MKQVKRSKCPLDLTDENTDIQRCEDIKDEAVTLFTYGLHKIKVSD